MNRRGRISLLGIFGILCVALFIALFAFGKESLTSVGSRFMSALGKGDVDTLTSMTYLGNSTPEEVRKQWDFAVNHAGKYYNFHYRITSAAASDDKTAAVNMQLMKNSDQPGSYEEAFEIPLVKVGDEWKVDVRGMSTEIYPGLPE